MTVKKRARAVKKSIYGFKNFTKWGVVVILAFPNFVSCGGKASPQALKIELQLPQKTDPDVFWHGVSKKTLKINSGKGNQEISYEPGASLPLEIPIDSSIGFFGNDSQGRIVVSGESKIPENREDQAVLVIPLNRIALTEL